MNRVLITGATGFIGSHCVPRLAQAGYEVHSAALEPVSASGATSHVVNLLDPGEVQDLLAEVAPTFLLHLAWYVAPGEYWRSVENVRWLAAGLDLAKAFADMGGRRAVFAGTCAEYDPTAGLRVEGVTALRPDSLYGATKAALHLTAAAYLAERAVSFAWAHIFHLFGDGEHPDRLVPSTIRTFSEGRRFVCRRPDDSLDFLHVSDVAGALVALLGSDVEGDVNVASGVPTTVAGLLEEIAMEMGVPDLLACEHHEGGPAFVVGDTTRLNLEVGWEASLTRREGIQSAIAWWRDHSTKSGTNASAEKGIEP